MREQPVDTAALSDQWRERWPSCRPIGHELRTCANGRWVRFHSLPESKRYAEDDEEYAEVLRRHNTVLGELVSIASVGSTELLIVTCAFSSNAEPVSREDRLAKVSPTATYWQSILRDTDDEWEYWNHCYVDRASWTAGLLDELLLLVADAKTGDVIIAGDELRWLYHPYDGGADVVTARREDRDALRAAHDDWLSHHPSGLERPYL